MNEDSEVVREIRNLIHPGRYVTDYPGIRITKKHLAMSFDVLQAAFEHLYSKIEETLLEHFREEGRP